MHRPTTHAVPVLAAALGLVVSGCASDDAGEGYAGVPIRWIVPSSPGGGFDTTSRQMEPFLAEALGTTATVENREGGGQAIGAQVMLSEGGAECTSIVTHGVPHLMFSYMTQAVDFDLSSFAPVGGISIEPGIVRVMNSAPWQSIQELVDDATARPGQIKFSVSLLQSNNYIALLQMERELGIDLNIIGYDGGGPSRTALVSGEVDATHAGVFNSLAIADDSRVLAVSQPENRWPDITNDAPPINEELGIELPPNASNYGLFASAECRDNNPERYQALVDGLKATLENPDYLAALTELGEESKVAYLTPDELEDLAQQSQDEIELLLEGNPNAFSG
ncbi:C4-dicarboxylate ABC transporter substrate-binding protein [Mycolicibacterium murale]|jgi:tripartite-type tricarboxylate transporter receptor subunit TctC|uniref:C4-dicarboxylate ABC transporter substrate-binding protein n=1 Tax=Mycolicibacterium murale TaxID=182220 RepID=A0A7I9WFX3_9MYCO|nr:C4-dicarboxylate ABC transporter substrate-binding protein [Mycolicibacterium murale]